MKRDARRPRIAMTMVAMPAERQSQASKASKSARLREAPRKREATMMTRSKEGNLERIL